MDEKTAAGRTQGVLALRPTCFWPFTQGLAALGEAPYALTSMGESPRYAPHGFFGERAVDLGENRWFALPRAACPRLNFSGERSAFTLAAWVWRRHKAHKECQAVAGMWNETDKLRQYALFLDLWIWDSNQQAAAHVSATGGATSGHPYCMDAAIGQTPVPLGAWQAVAVTYDGQAAAVYHNGRLDSRPGRNPYPYGRPLFAPLDGGADFTVGAVYRGGEMGNWMEGLLGGLAVFDRALTPAEIARLPRPPITEG